MTAIVDVREATVAYGSRPVLERVSLAVQPGDVVAILGANGSGKSTLVRAVLNLVPLVSGSVRLFGVDKDSRAMRRNWRRIGYVP